MYISSDTNVWIDFHEIGHLDHPFRLDFQYFISNDTFCEEFLRSNNMRDDLIKYGLQLTNITDEEFSEAIVYTTRYPQLSLYDAFALAIAKYRKWTLLTGDLPLRKAAAKESVEYHGTIWIYDQLLEQKKMTFAEYSTVIGELINAVNTGQIRLPMVELLKRRMGKALVAFFSASGVTAKEAETLSEAIGADLFEITPAVPYTKGDLDWMDKNSRSSIEMRDLSSRPAMERQRDNMADYDTVFCGVPHLVGYSANHHQHFLGESRHDWQDRDPLCDFRRQRHGCDQ